MEKEIEILADNYVTETVVFPVERSGWIDGVVKKRPDRLPADDTRYFTLNVRDRTRVLLLADEGGFYLEQALVPGGVEGDVAVVKRGWRAFTSADLGAADVVVLGPGTRSGAGRRRDRRSFRRARRHGDRVSRAGAQGGRRAAQPVSAQVRIRRNAAGLLPALETGGRAGLSRAVRREGPRGARAPEIQKRRARAGSSSRSRDALVREERPLRMGREARRGNGRVRRRRSEAGGGRARALAVFPAARAAARARDGPGAAAREGSLVGEPILWNGEGDGAFTVRASRRRDAQARGSTRGEFSFLPSRRPASSPYSPAPR